MNFSAEEFRQFDLRVGRILDAKMLDRSDGMYSLKVDFGPDVGAKAAVLRAGEDYDEADLKGRLVVGAVNLTPKRIRSVMSEALILGARNRRGGVVLLITGREAMVGSKIY